MSGKHYDHEYCRDSLKSGTTVTMKQTVRNAFCSEENYVESLFIYTSLKYFPLYIRNSQGLQTCENVVFHSALVRTLRESIKTMVHRALNNAVSSVPASSTFSWSLTPTTEEAKT